jgi:hypothetical protein
MLIEQGASDNDIFMILAGTLDIVVNGRVVGRRGPSSTCFATLGPLRAGITFGKNRARRITCGASA